MSVIHVNQIKGQVLKLFQDLIDISDVQNHPNSERFLLTRGLAAYSIYYLCAADLKAVSNSITDGGDDNGIDAIYFDERDKILYLVQSKWMQDGSGEPANADVKKFIAGIRDLLNLRFDKFNLKVQAMADMVRRALDDPSTRCEVVLAYTGANSLAEPSEQDLQELAAEMNDTSEVLHVSVLNQKDLHSSLAAAVTGEPINLQISLKAWGKVQSPHTAFYGQVNGVEVASWWTQYRARLVAKNLRGVLGDTEVNEEIKQTILNKPELFWYFNNGITIVTRKLTKTIAGGSDTDFGHLHCEDMSVVNGAQTVATIGKHAGLEQLNKVFIPVRIISLEGAEPNFGEVITRTNNRQNRIENRDFVSQDPVQFAIKTELAIDKIDYQVMRTEGFARTDSAFDLVESTTALACAADKVDLVVQLKREIGRLWDDIEKAPYKELFNAAISGLYVWRCVQVQRKIDRALEQLLKTKTGREYGIAVHGNRLIAKLVFDQLNSTSFKDPAYGFDAGTGDPTIVNTTETFYDLLVSQVEKHYSNAVIPTLFKNLTKCKDLVQKIKNDAVPA